MTEGIAMSGALVLSTVVIGPARESAESTNTPAHAAIVVRSYAQREAASALATAHDVAGRFSLTPPKCCVAGSTHQFKYRLAYVVDGVCVVRYDNEVGKGDHRHFGEEETAYPFETPDKLIADFQRDIARWNRENRHS